MTIHDSVRMFRINSAHKQIIFRLASILNKFQYKQGNMTEWLKFSIKWLLQKKKSRIATTAPSAKKVTD